MQRLHRVLEDHRDVVTAHPTQLLVGGGDHVLPGHLDGAGDLRPTATVQTHQGQRGHALTRTRLAHDPQGASGGHLEGETLHRVDVTVHRREGHPQIVHPYDCVGGSRSVRGHVTFPSVEPVRGSH
ncbi:putative oligopeptide/dipeptide ABC transporter, ATP-binding protein [Nocardiopsis alba ATCC BAA-2165]|uniref:Putative oligopeptide/dipeptide ABC transporter, ATP-binding protein n=1 Tax=Nocardiopsis alba (strain ATCC BAA-2165 / BE74) TaxID=1205910 RepID=J7L2B9_NOCAA|nr:putative oligopeptide/dipeptide ABC transporter, ATP-binding protein [Nocardiopsis alba ATCC BAA-2165]